MPTPPDAGLLLRARRYLADAGRGFEHAPVEVALAAAVTVAFSWALEQDGEAMRAWVEVAIVALLMAAAAWSGTLLHACGAMSARRRWAVTLAGAVAAGIYGHAVLDLDRAAEGWRAAVLVAGAASWVAALPVFARTPAGPHATGSATARVRRMGGRLLLRGLGAGLYAAALYAGLALAIGAVDSLFELDLDGKLYGHVFGLVFLLLVPWVVAGGVPDLVRPAAHSDVAGAVHRLSAFLVPPLLAIYLLILYAYAVRIGVTGEVPKNLVSPLVLAAGVLSALALLLFDPPPAAPPGRRWLRAVPLLFLPLALLGGWTLWIRVAQYGWTEPRLIRLALLAGLALLAAGGALQQQQGRRFALHAVPLLAAALLLLGAVGPWSVTAVARRDQQARLVAALQEVAVLRPDGTPAERAEAERTVAADAYDRIRDGAAYVERHFGAAALPAPLRPAAADGHYGRDHAAAIGLLRERTPGEPDTRGGFAALEPGGAVPLPDGGAAYRVEVVVPGHAPGGTVATQEGPLLHLRVGGGTYTAAIGATLAALGTELPVPQPTPDRRIGGPGPHLPPGLAALAVTDTAGRARGTLVIFNIGADPPLAADAAPRLRHLSGVLILGSDLAAAAGRPDL